MENWLQIISDEVLQELSPVERATLLNIRQQQDNLPNIIDRVAREIRESYRDGGRLINGPDGTIPEGEKPRAIAMARWLLLISYPALKVMQTDARKSAHDDAKDYLMKVAKRELRGEGGVEVARKQRRRATHKKLGGLI